MNPPQDNNLTNLREIAYLLGLRAGDIHARKHSNRVVAEVTSSRPEQIKMFQKIFSRYSKVSVYEKKGGITERTTRAYCYLDNTFHFLIKKPESIPKWILEKDELFYSFLAGYVDSEGSWIITQHKKYNGKYKDLIFSLGSCDKIILEQIHERLKNLKFNSHFYLVRKAGVHTGIGVCNFDLYRVMIMKQEDVAKLAKILLPLSNHERKKERMKMYFFKKQNLGTIKIPCIYCNHKKVWKNGFEKYANKKYQRYKCPICKKEFSEQTIQKLTLMESEVKCQQ